jgi:hypothetical protein
MAQQQSRVSHELRMEGRSWNLSDRGDEYVKVGSGKSAMDREATEPAWMTPEFREKMMKRCQESVAAMDQFMYGREKFENSAGGTREEKAENGLGRGIKMMRISPERPLSAEIERALLDIQEKLTKKKIGIWDKETLRRLKDLSNMLDQGGDGDEKDETEYESSKSATPLAKKTVAEEIAKAGHSG